MMDDTSAHVTHELARSLLEWFTAVAPGTAMRIDNMTADQAQSIVAEVATIAGDMNVSPDGLYVLGSEDSGINVSVARATELRNNEDQRKRKLVLLVPHGVLSKGQESSLNPFKAREFSELVHDSAELVKAELSAAEEFRSILARLDRHKLLPLSSLDTLDFLSSIRPERSVQWGEHLWRLGLVPDLGPEPLERLVKNLSSVKEIATPQARGSSVSARLTKIQLVGSGVKARLVAHLSQRPLHNPKAWTRSLLAENNRALTFEKWAFGSDAEVSLKSLELVPFLNSSGNPQSWSGLRASEGNLLTLPMRSDSDDVATGTVVVKWKTNPTNPTGVSGFRVEVIPSQMAIDLGADDTPIVEEIAKSSARQQRVNVAVGSEHAHLGDRFAIRLSALDEAGQVAAISKTDEESATGSAATVVSEEFRVEVTGFDAEVYEREPSADSVAAARLDANLAGEDAVTPDRVAWDDDAQLLSVKFGATKAYSVRYSAALRVLEQQSLGNKQSLTSFSFASDGLEVITESNVAVKEWVAPKGLITARKKFLRHVEGNAGEQGLRGLIAAHWDSDAIALGLEYLASYKRALDAAEGEALTGLLLADTLTIRMKTGQGDVKAMVLLPSHPLRIGWMAKFEDLLQSWGSAVAKEGKSVRSQKLDVALVNRIAPSNLPYVLVDEQSEPFVYHSELTFGSGLYLALSQTDLESAVSPVLSALRLPRRSSGNGSVDSMLERKISEYREVHTLSTATFSVNAVNPGDGSVVASAVDRSLGITSPPLDAQEPVAVKVSCFSESVSATDPVPKLRELQLAHSAAEFEKAKNFLVPPFSLSSALLDQLHLMKPANVGILQGLSGANLSSSEPPARGPLLRGLISPLEVTRVIGSSTHDELAVLASLKSPGGAEHAEIPQAHLAHQTGVARALGMAEGVPGLSMKVSPEIVQAITALHDKSDWVVTIDRNVGATTFEELVRPHLPDSVLLDYAPEFVDGFSDRLSVTTTHRGEIDLALKQGMAELGLGQMGRGPKEIVKSLTDISGRLVLRLYKPNSLAREAVGLAAVMAFLENKGALKNTIIIPLDAHPEIFSPSRRDTGENALRCDLMLIRVTRRSLKIELVEVKARKSLNKPDGALNAHIEDQLIATESFLQSRVLPLGDSRIDAELQWVRTVSLLHFYAERAAYAGRIDRENLRDIHAAISKLGENPVEPSYTLTGYVVTLNSGGTDPVVAREKAKIYYLTADSLQALGFTTDFDSAEESSASSQEFE
jgi:DNA phosphorothioation-dependent restriction protein DptH